MATRFAFIPNRLTVAKRFELNVFPLNVLFASQSMRDGVALRGSALYEPDLSSYRAEGGAQSMLYYNKYGRDWRLLIKFDAGTGRYEGVKYHGDEVVVAAFGSNWQSFFVNFSGRGLADGERCAFSEGG